MTDSDNSELKSNILVGKLEKNDLTIEEVVGTLTFTIALDLIKGCLTAKILFFVVKEIVKSG